MMWPGPPDDLAPDVISSGSEDSGLLARWFGRLGRQAGRIRRRPVAAAMLAGAVLAGAIAAAVVLVPSSHPSAGSAAPRPRGVPARVSTLMTGKLAPGGVFASGTANGVRWQLAVQDIALPGARCQPAVTLNGNDADPLFPDPPRLTPVGNPAFMTLGAAMPGAGFAFIQVPANADWVWLEPGGIGGIPLGMDPITITSCGERFHLVGFGYPLTGTLRIHETSVAFDNSYTVPSALSAPRPSLAVPQVDGVWQDPDAARAQVASATLATGNTFGGPWTIRVAFGTAGDCFTIITAAVIDDSANAQPEQMSGCAPVSTPQGPDTIMALPLGPPAPGGQGAGYAISVGPGIGRLLAQFSDGSTKSVTPVQVGGRKYAAFYVAAPLHLTWLNWISTGGREIAGVQDLPQYGYTQFQP